MYMFAAVIITVVLVIAFAVAMRSAIADGVNPLWALGGVVLVALLIWGILQLFSVVSGKHIGYIHWPFWVWLVLVLILLAAAAWATQVVPLLALFAALVAFFTLFGGVSPAVAKAKPAAAKPKIGGVTTTSTTTPTDCGPDGIKEVDKPHDGGKVDSNGLPAGTAQQKRDYLLAAMGQTSNGNRTADPAVVMLFWDQTSAGSSDPVTDPHQLVDANGCFNARGRQVANDTVAVYKEAAVVTDNAPATAVNTGADASGPFQEPSGPITGDRSGILMTLPSGKKVWVMNRCVNSVTEAEVKGVPTKTVSTTVATVTTVVTNTTRPPVNTTVPTTNTTRPGNTTTTRPPSSTTVPVNTTVPNNTTTTKGPLNLRGPQNQDLHDNAAAAVAPTPGFSPSTNATVVADQHTTDPAATSGSVGTPYGVDTGSHETSSNIPASADTNNPSTPPGSSAGIATPPTAPPDSGQTTVAPTCDVSSC